MILFQEHFDGYTDTTGYRNAVQNVSSNAVYSAVDGRWAGGALRPGSLSTGDVRLLKASPGGNMLRLMFWFKSTENGSATGTRHLFQFRDAATTRFWHMYFIGGAPAGIFRLSKFDDTSAATTSFETTKPINDGDWHHVEIELSAHATTGSLKIWVDGVLDTNSISSGDTSDAVSLDVTAFDRIIIAGVSNNTSNATNTWIDDIVVWDDIGTDFVGSFASTRGHRLRKHGPSANGADGVQWTPLAGANWDNVDEDAYDGDTSYNSETTPGEIDWYAKASLGMTLSTSILAVMVENIARIDTGTHALRNKLKTGSTISNGATSAALTATYRKHWDAYGKNPDGAIAWTQAAIQSAQWGVEMVS